MSLLSLNIKTFSLKDIKLPAQKERELKPLEDEVEVKTFLLKDIQPKVKPIIENKVKEEPIVENVKIEPTVVLKQPEIKTLWNSLDNNSRAFWIVGGRGGEISFNSFENNKKY
jgi:hypothetical protein